MVSQRRQAELDAARRSRDQRARQSEKTYARIGISAVERRLTARDHRADLAARTRRGDEDDVLADAEEE